MSLVDLRRRGAPLSAVTLASFLLSLTPARSARAEGSDEPRAVTALKAVAADDARAAAQPEAAAHSTTSPAEDTLRPAVSTAETSAEHKTRPEAGGSAHVTATERPAVAAFGGATHFDSLPVAGGDKTGVSSQAISLPQGSGKVQGMGESFAADLSTGAASFSVPLQLPKARGGAQPSLTLQYSSSAGHGVVGVGWDLAVSFIARQTDRGAPQYADPLSGAAWTPMQDRFVFNGGQELVPICLVSGTTCTGALAGEVMPPWASGWQYFRPRVEGAFLRFFWSPNHQTWRVQNKNGTSMELGVPLDSTSYLGGIETDQLNAGHIFRWNVVREYDAYGSANPAGTSTPAPVNVIVYRYLQDGNMAYVQDIYDTPPVTNTTTAPLSAFAHHAHVNYEARPDPTITYRRGWSTTQALRVHGVDVASENFAGSGPRELVRRYHLSYDPGFHVSLLTSLQMEGRCASVVQESSSGVLPSVTGCPALPAMTFNYQHVAPFDTSGGVSTADVAGWEGFDERIHPMAGSPDHSLDEALTDLFDINADGLPDVVVTAPYLYNGKHAVFFNGVGGHADSFGGNQCLDVAGVPGEDTNVIRLDNPNLSVHDVDGDGIVNLLHMPLVKSYSVYTPMAASPCWLWQGRTITTASQQNPKVDFTNDNAAIKVMDVNGDGLVDVVFSSGTEYETFFGLGRYPGGDSQYGSGQWTSSKAASIVNDPVTSCLPWDASPVLLSDKDVKIGDMNGDGLPDLVRVRPGDIRYWPGRGNGYWGTGDPNGCPGNTYGQSQDIAMSAAPEFGVVDATQSLLVDDVNGDGLDDLVKVEFNAIYIWLNIDGTSWTAPHIIQNAPPRSPGADRMRLVDLNGSGTRDIVYGDGNSYKYMDVNGGSRPWVLTHVQNGLGKTTDIAYGSSTQLMLADAAAGTPWTSVAPMPIHVVTQVTESDHLDAVGRAPGVFVTQYSYRDAVYDGRQREFRGFRTARVRKVGDANSPSSTTESTFLLGECKNDENASPDPCTPAGAWQGNPREALKGVPLLTETHDDFGTYLSTTHHTYRLRKLYTGLDGREVRQAFESQTDDYLYDDGPFVPSPQMAMLTDVELETTLGTATVDTTSAPTLRSAAGRAHTHKGNLVDSFGNTTDSIDDGCTSGCASVDESITTHTTAARPSSDTSAWMFRTSESYVVGSIVTSKRKDMLFTYDVGGSALQTSAVLAGSLALDRFHQDTSKTIAPAPPNASADGTIVVDTKTYDAFGQINHEVAPNSRCRDVTYDSVFGELPAIETIYVGAVSNGCGATALHTTASSYDRGLALPLSITDLHGELTAAVYDGLGRITSLYKPDPNTSNVGKTPAAASVVLQYFLPTDPTVTPYSIVHAQEQNGADANTASYQDRWTYTDGLGRDIVTLDQADPAAGDGGAWIVDGLSDFDAKGAARRKYLAWFWNGSSPSQFPLGTTPSGLYGRQRYDAFDHQLQTFGLDGEVALQSVYHALSVDRWDAADLLPGQHQGTPATETKDGHGRTTATTERIHNGNSLEARDTRTTYLPTGEKQVVTRVRVGASDAPVVRWMQYDTLGRMVLNVDPDTTQSFNASPSTNPSSMHAWRYAYNNNGDLVGTSDARGCGTNYLYDAGGRIVAEDFSPCLTAQAAYSTPSLTTGNGTEAFYTYDAYDADTKAISGFPSSAGSFVLGRVASISDRGAKTANIFDGRGRIVQIFRHVAQPTANDTLSSRYASHWYTQTFAFDAADRPVSATTGADVTQLLDASGKSTVTTAYSQRGTVKSVSSGYGALVSSITRDADGLVSQIVYGDAANTTTSLSYDGKRRLSSAQTYRGAPAIWSSPPASYSPAPTPGAAPSSFQLLLEDMDYVYDDVDNPIELRDWRNPAEWPAGAQPVARKFAYDDLYRVSGVSYASPQGADTWVSPFDAENRSIDTDPRRAKPSPHVSFSNRVMSQSMQYDWIGNTTRTDDDAHGFYDRSLGPITNGTASAGPYQIKAATGTGPRGGSLSTAYDPAGNLTSLSVTRSGPCLPSAAICSQRFGYDWDEVGRLVRARRWDTASPGAATSALPTATPNADLRYTYDVNDARTLKTAIDSTGTAAYSAYVFSSLELRGATFASSDYAHTSTNEVAYLSAHGVRLGRVHYSAPPATPTESGTSLHILLELMDHLGSTEVAIDRDTGEVAERNAYLADGRTDSDYRPARWNSFREDYRFTGKEEDIEVGLQYFGKRFYAPSLGRWMSPDPLAVHSLEADLNLFGYVRGRLIASTDPVGLAEGSSSPTLIRAGCVLPDRAVLSLAERTQMEKGGLAAQMLDHNLDATGTPMRVVLQGMLSKDEGMSTFIDSQITSQIQEQTDAHASASQDLGHGFRSADRLFERGK